MRTLSLLAAVAAALSAGPALAATFTVGTCNSAQYSTIQAAVSAAPQGSTIDVCPGIYPEQVTINKNLTLTGIAPAAGGADAAVIVAPAGGYAANNARVISTHDGVPFAAGILVYGSAPPSPQPRVTITNIVVDATGNNTSGNYALAGIAYQYASGVVQHDTVLHVDIAPSNGLQTGYGIYAEEGSSDTISISYNHVEDYQKNGIAVRYGGTATITGNTVIGQGPTTGAAENGIELAFGVAKGTVTGNTVADDIWATDSSSDSGDAAAGILVYQLQQSASPMTITSNSVSNTQFGIAVINNDGTTIKANSIQATHIWDGIDACSNTNTIGNNKINGSDESAIHLDASCDGSTGNTVELNTITGACVGVLEDPTATGTLSSNTYYGAGTEVMTGSGSGYQCSSPL